MRFVCPNSPQIIQTNKKKRKKRPKIRTPQRPLRTKQSKLTFVVKKNFFVEKQISKFGVIGSIGRVCQYDCLFQTFSSFLFLFFLFFLFGFFSNCVSLFLQIFESIEMQVSIPGPNEFILFRAKGGCYKFVRVAKEWSKMADGCSIMLLHDRGKNSHRIVW